MAAAFQFPGFQLSAFQKAPAVLTVTSRTVLQDPVDCVMAGDQDDDERKRSPLTPRRGHATFRALRGIFRE